jgi:hypothetical protein
MQMISFTLMDEKIQPRLPVTKIIYTAVSASEEALQFTATAPARG